jgi:hypothetical protein
VNRYTFVIQIHPSGPSTLENLSTQERVRIADLGAVGLQIERWLAELPTPPGPSASRADPEAPSPGAPPS